MELTDIFRISSRIGPSVNACYDFNEDIQQKKYPWKKKVTREKKSKFSPWNEILCPWKNIKWVPVKKKVGVKKTEKSVREKVLPPVKKPEKTPKLVFTGTFYFHGEKKNTAVRHAQKYF